MKRSMFETPHAPIRRAVKVALRIAAGLALLLGAYAAAGLVGGVLPVNAGWRAPAGAGPGDVTIFIESNGIHTGIVVPKVAAGVDWRGVFPGSDLADPRYGGWDHLAIGWGEQAFYLGTPTWSDVRPGTVLAAAIGSNATLLHVEHLAEPRPSPTERRVVLRPEEYRRLAGFIRASLVAGGRRYRGYDRFDVFYQARGRYNAVHTCNNWTGQALRRAGIRVGAWTPFPVTVMRWF